MIGAYDVTDPRTLKCEFCGELVRGRVMFEMHGGSLMVCEGCLELLRQSRSHPYSQVMDRFALQACGYLANRKMARWGR
jgi:ribosome-binding protein aMBF1 (putative translation factor)